jgi:hypothetical protein
LDSWTVGRIFDNAAATLAWEETVKKTLSAILFAAAILPSAAQAQLMIDMNRLTCAQFVAMSPQQARIYSAWMSGFFNQKTGYAWVDLEAYERNFANVRQFCAQFPNDTVMAALQRATAR